VGGKEVWETSLDKNAWGKGAIKSSPRSLEDFIQRIAAERSKKKRRMMVENRPEEKRGKMGCVKALYQKPESGLQSGGIVKIRKEKKGERLVVIIVKTDHSKGSLGHM